jgi:putative membrane protein
MRFILNLLINALIIIVLSYVLPGVETSGFVAALVVAFVVAILNFLVRPILVILTLPVTIITLGLFLIVINAIILLIADWFVPGFDIDGLGWAILFSILLSIARAITEKLIEKGDR